MLGLFSSYRHSDQLFVCNNLKTLQNVVGCREMEYSERLIFTNIFWAMLWVNDRPELFFILIIHFKAFNIDECLEDKFITKFIAEKHKCITCPSFYPANQYVSIVYDLKTLPCSFAHASTSDIYVYCLHKFCPTYAWFSSLIKLRTTVV